MLTQNAQDKGMGAAGLQDMGVWEYQCRQNHEENNMKKKHTNNIGIKHDSLKRL